MRIEAFSRGKQHARPQENEDSLLVLPGLGYAVLDGVTDRSARRYGGERAGRFASRTVADRLTEVFPSIVRGLESGEARAARLVAAAIEAIAAAYVAHDLLAEAEARPAIRMGCTLAAALHDRDGLTLVSVGDTGMRVTLRDAVRVSHVEAKPLDTVTALMRREAWRWAEARGASAEIRRSLSDAACWNGLAAAPDGLSAAETRALEGRVLAVCVAALPTVAATEIARLVATGIAGQRVFANHADLDLGYGVLDGFPIPARHVFSATYPLAEVERLEIFSDGYFTEADGFGVEAWEAHFRDIERLDPDKIDLFPSTKGSTETAWTDDRTYLGIDFRD